MKLALLSGAHVHTPGYLKLIRERDDLELAVVWDDMPSRGQAIADDMGCPFEADLDAALAADGLDAVCICADNASHRPLVEAAAAKKLDIFCEKPMALTVEDADAMLDAIRAAGVIAVFGFFQPYTGPAMAARKALSEGTIGEVTHLTYYNAHHAAYGRWFDRPEYQWFTDPDRAGGGAFCDMGAHALHYVRLVFGPAKSIQATISNKSGNYPNVDDHGMALIEFDSGVTALVTASWVQTVGPRGMEVVGSGGRLAVDGDCKVTPFADNKAGETYTLDPETAEPSRLERLIALREGKLSREAADHDLDCCRDAVAMSVGAYRSSRTGERVAL